MVVDNFSTQTERDAVTAVCAGHGWQLVTAESNLGFGAGNNLGVASAAAAGAERLLVAQP